MNSEIIDPMLERVAKAIATSQGSGDWRAQVVAARACVEALREPSDAMLEAATTGLPDWGDLPRDWRAMIDHVLGEEPSSNDNNVVEPPSRIAR